MASRRKKRRCLLGSFREDLFAVLVAKRFDKVRQTREWIGYWYRQISVGIYRIIRI